MPNAPKKILVPTDFSQESNHALRYAASLGERFGATLQLVHVVTVHGLESAEHAASFPDLEPLLEAADRAARSHLDAGVDHGGAAEATVESRVLRGFNAWDPILEHAGRDDVDLVVMAMHSGSRLGRFLLGSVTERVLRSAPCPVLVVERGDRDFVDPDTMAVRIRRVVVADDLSDTASAATRDAATWFAPYKPVFDLVHAVDFDVPAPYMMAGVRSVFELDAGLRERLEGELGARGRQALPESWSLNTVVREGRPHRVVTDYADEVEADLLVVAGESHIDLAERVFGGTVERIARHAPCPLLVL